MLGAGQEWYSEMKTKIWGNTEKAKILVIGHDPGLQRSSTIADYCFFADYYFRPKPSHASELSKYKLAESLFRCIMDLTAEHFSNEEILITNLCNEVLPQSRIGKINYIPRGKAEDGLQTIRNLLKGSNVKLIFPMSQQVNYWLQELGFYPANTRFIEQSEPRGKGTTNEQPYYEPKKPRAFKEVCGNKYLADNQYFLFPILHVKSYPLKGRLLTYEDNYINCKKKVKELIDSLDAKNKL